MNIHGRFFTTITDLIIARLLSNIQLGPAQYILTLLPSKKADWWRRFINATGTITAAIKTPNCVTIARKPHLTCSQHITFQFYLYLCTYRRIFSYYFFVFRVLRAYGSRNSAYRFHTVVRRRIIHIWSWKMVSDAKNYRGKRRRDARE